MRLLIVRHAPAAPRAAAGRSDDERPLTKEGAAAFAQAARGLARALSPPDLVLTSPLLRARQTAEIARAAWKSPRANAVAERALAGVALAPVLALLARHSRRDLVAIFGHEPGVSALLAHLIGGDTVPALAFKKGGAALVETREPRRRGSGRLIWFLPPKVLSALGGRR